MARQSGAPAVSVLFCHATPHPFDAAHLGRPEIVSQIVRFVRMDQEVLPHEAVASVNVANHRKSP